MKTTLTTFLLMIVLSVNAQKIATNIDAETISKLKWNKWTKVSETKAIYSIFFSAGSSSNRPNNPTMIMENNVITVCGNVPYLNEIVHDDYMIPTLYIEIDIKLHPDYKSIPVFYKRNTIESYAGMQNDLQEWGNQVYFKSAQVEVYSYEKHRKVIEKFITNFKFKGTKLEDLKALLFNTDCQIDYLGQVTYNNNIESSNLTWLFPKVSIGIRLDFTNDDLKIIKSMKINLND